MKSLIGKAFPIVDENNVVTCTKPILNAQGCENYALVAVQLNPNTDDLILIPYSEAARIEAGDYDLDGPCVRCTYAKMERS